jgi:hypothetical protein
MGGLNSEAQQFDIEFQRKAWLACLLTRHFTRRAVLREKPMALDDRGDGVQVPRSGRFRRMPLVTTAQIAPTAPLIAGNH